MRTLKDRLEEAVREKGISTQQARRDLAHLTGMTRSNMSHWFTGKTEAPTTAAAFIAAEYLGVDPQWLSSGVGKRRPSNGTAARGARMRAIHSSSSLTQADLDTLLAIYTAMDEDTRRAWRRTGQELLKLGEKRKPKRKGARSKRPREQTKLDLN